MSRGKSKDSTRGIELMAAACNRIHRQLEIPAIMRAAASSACELVDAEVASTGLFIRGEMAFTESVRQGDWNSFTHRLGTASDIVGLLIRDGRPLLNNEVDSSFDSAISADLGEIRNYIAIPIFGNRDGLVGCLLVFNKQGSKFDSKDMNLLEQMTSSASIAIDNAIRLSESRTVEEDLQKSVATYRTLVEQIPAITYIATLDRSRILFVSPQIETILGYAPDHFLSRPELWKKQIHAEDRERVLAEMRRSHAEGKPFHAEYRIVTNCGEEIWFKDAAAVVRDNEHALYLQGVMYDITERKQFESKLMKMAHFDQLTGLANRSLFHDRLNRAVARSKRQQSQFAVLYLDLDGFKAVNDSFGHQAGDTLLAQSATRMLGSVRETDTVARMGGDEFTIILSDTGNRDDIERVTRKLLKVIATPFEHEGHSHRISASIGISLYPDNAERGDALVTAADNAMYQAKQSGKNQFFFSEEVARQKRAEQLAG